MEVTCSNCNILLNLPDDRVPIGRSYIVCPKCNSRINIFVSVAPGATLTNLAGLRFLGDNENLNERFCDQGELWRVVEVVEPCPDKGKGRACEAENRGRCPNQRLVIRLRGDKTRYKTCLYRQGRRIFAKNRRSPVGNSGVSSGCNFPD